MLIGVAGILLCACAAFNYAVDPLFYYHLPWFGMKPVLVNRRYQIAGMVRNFKIENAVIGNSLAENILQEDLELALGGKVTRLTAPGSHPLDWRLVLNQLKLQNRCPRKILFNLDPYIFTASTTHMKHPWPNYLYDTNPFNDVRYLLNFDILWDYSFGAVRKNKSGKVPTIDDVYTWNNNYGREYILRKTHRHQIINGNINAEKYVQNALDNLGLLTEFFDAMPETEFIFFCSPFSIIYWDKTIRGKSLVAEVHAYSRCLEFLLRFPNVRVYFWEDEEMRRLICNLDYYRDEAHFDKRAGKFICGRIARGEGMVTPENMHRKLATFFDFLRSYDYEQIWK